jgi:putative DNA primase/helicase
LTFLQDDVMAIQDEFLAAMTAAGIVPVSTPAFPDGKMVRFRVEGDKSGSRNGWAILHSSPVVAGAFGSWKTGESNVFRLKDSRKFTPQEWDEYSRAVQHAKAAYAAERAEVQANAAARATKIWESAKPANDSHPYLQTKKVHTYGLRALGDRLLVPARDTAGNIHTLQFIEPDGAKRFLTGGRIKGCYYGIGRIKNRILVAEGYATGATLYQATGHAVAVCFNCVNIFDVVKALRAKYPAKQFVICADNDARTEGNPGLTNAMKAARAVNGLIAVPYF